MGVSFIICIIISEDGGLLFCSEWHGGRCGRELLLKASFGVPRTGKGKKLEEVEDTEVRGHLALEITSSLMTPLSIARGPHHVTRERSPQAHFTRPAKAQDHISALVRKARASTSQKVSLVLFQQVAMQK